GTRQNLDARRWEMVLEAPDRRGRADAVAEMVKLDDEDTPDAVAVEKRAGDTDGLGEFVVDDKVVDMRRQGRMVVRVTLSEHPGPLPLERPLVEMVGGLRPRRLLVVDQRRIGGIDAQEAGATNLEAEIEVVIGDVVRLVEPAELTKQFTPGHQAGAGQRRDVALRPREPEIAELVSVL